MAKLRDIAKETFSTSGDFGKLRDGLNLLRIVSEFEPIYSHWDRGENKGHTCTNNGQADTYNKAMEGNCAYCRLEWQAYQDKLKDYPNGIIDGKRFYPPRPSLRYMVNAIDLNGVVDKITEKVQDIKTAYADEENYSIRHYEMPYSVIEQLKGAQEFDPDWDFDIIPPFDIKITRSKTGTKPTDVTYLVGRATSNRDLNSFEEEMIKGFDSPEEVVAKKISFELGEKSDPGPQEPEETHSVHIDGVANIGKKKPVEDEIKVEDIPPF